MDNRMSIKHPLFPDKVYFMNLNGFDEEEIDDTLEEFYKQFLEVCRKYSEKIGSAYFRYIDYCEIIKIVNDTIRPSSMVYIKENDFKILSEDISESLKRIDPESKYIFRES